MADLVLPELPVYPLLTSENTSGVSVLVSHRVVLEYNIPLGRYNHV